MKRCKFAASQGRRKLGQQPSLSQSPSVQDDEASALQRLAQDRAHLIAQLAAEQWRSTMQSQAIQRLESKVCLEQVFRTLIYFHL